MSQHATRIAADISMDVARHGALLGTALQYGLHQRRRHVEAHRRAGVDAVTDLAARLQEARASEDEAWAAASSLSSENAALRQALATDRAALAEAQDRIARLEQAVLTAAAHLAR